MKLAMPPAAFPLQSVHCSSSLETQPCLTLQNPASASTDSMMLASIASALLLWDPARLQWSTMFLHFCQSSLLVSRLPQTFSERAGRRRNRNRVGQLWGQSVTERTGAWK